MTTAASHSRRLFFKTALAAAAGFGVWLMDVMARRSAMLPETSMTTVSLPMPAGNAARFYDDAIVITEKGQTAVFSPVCPHLGCHINRLEEGELICPCHGSRFNLRGQLTHGPSTQGLQPLSFEIDAVRATLRIAVKS